MINSWKAITGVLFFLILLSVLTVAEGFWTESRFQKNIEHSIVDLNHLDRNLNENFIKSKQSLVNNYDFIKDNNEKIEEELTRLREGALYLENLEIHRLVDRLASQFEEKMRLADHYRREHSIITNSVNYLPQFYENFSLKNIPNEIKQKVQLAILLSYQQYVIPSDLHRERIVKINKEIRPYLKGDDIILLHHMQIILQHSESMYLTIAQFLEINSKATITQLHQANYQAVRDFAKTSRYFNIGICILVFLTFACLLGLLYHKGNQERKMQAELDHQRAQSTNAAKMAALGEMAGQIAHEINTPLGTMVLVSKMLQRKNEQNQLEPLFLKNQLSLLVKVSDSISKIVGSMKNFARSGSAETVTTCPVHQIIDELLLLCAQKVKKSGASLDINLGGNQDVMVSCRTFQIVQVLINLVGNSVHAVEAVENRSVTIDVNQLDGNLIFSVSDTGLGIPTDIRGKIFDPQFTTKPVGEGTGIGLSISKKIVEEHGGELYLDESKEKTTFVFFIPIKGLQAAA